VKFLIVSNTPNTPTGYGMQCAMLALRLQAAGHEVAVASTYGQQGEIGNWRGILVYPSGWAEQSADVLHLHAMHWFDNDPRGGWIITLVDVWGLKSPVLSEFNVAAWCPIDHDPASPMTVEWLRRTGAVPIAMSQFGERALRDAGLDPHYVPLATDTTVYKPTPTLTVGDRSVDARTYYGVPQEAFVVGMVAMNKDPGDRKGFNEALRGFAKFHQSHPEAVLLLHNEPHGIQGGIDLYDVAKQAGLPEGAVVWTDQYAYRIGFSRQMMAALYTSMDVLLAPSRGEGFCVPLIEAQACGTPVIASNFTAQPELVGAGWLIDGQIEYDPSHRSNYYRAYIDDVAAKLETAYTELGERWDTFAATGVAFAADYDADAIWERHWLPFLATIVPPEPDPKPPMERVDVIVPFMRRANIDRLIRSFDETNDGTATLVIVHDAGNPPPDNSHTWVDMPTASSTYAEKVNEAYAQLGTLIGEDCDQPGDWILIVGDDCEFAPGWVEAARKVSDRFDVIGTNDSEPGRVRNPEVAAGRHADHAFIRRSYIDEQGASLDGPGVLMPTAYRHWFVDREVIELAKARGVFTPCLDSVIVHHHPGYDGDEEARMADPTYMKAVVFSDDDRRTWMSRAPLIENHRR
jgi:glycosyltransferase involved in cell wall biosynthesis